MSDRINFTKKNISQIVAKERAGVIYDIKTDGFRLVLSPLGTCTYQVYARLHGSGTAIKHKIGRYPEMSPEAARSLARDVILLIRQGINPNKKKKKSELTYADIWAPYRQYLINRTGLKPKTQKRNMTHQESLHKKTEQFRDEPLSKLTTDYLRQLHRTQSVTHGPIVANEVIRQISACLNFAGWEANPTKNIKLNPTTKRKKYLTPAEIPLFLTALFADNDADYRDIFLICLYTASRIGVVMSMEWAELDLQRGLWTPVTKTSTSEQDKTHIALVNRAITLLKRRQWAASDSQWVFPSSYQAGHLCYPDKPFRRILQRAGLRGFVPHDLRHTAATWFAQASATNQELLTLLGNSSEATIGIYTHMDVYKVKSQFNVVLDNVIKTLPANLQEKVNAGDMRQACS
jgi:integrase